MSAPSDGNSSSVAVNVRCAKARPVNSSQYERAATISAVMYASSVE
jgi:hypothetical protein